MVKRWSILFVMLFFIVGGANQIWCQVQNPDSFIEGLLKELTNKEIFTGIPVYRTNSQLMGYLVSTKIDGNPAELLYSNDSLIAFGQGEFLTTSYATAEEIMKNTLSKRYGDEAQLIDRRLILINPLRFVIQGKYLYQGKIIDDLIFQCHSSIFTLENLSAPQLNKSESLKQKIFSIDQWRVSYQIPIYQFYLSDFSTCILMLANYWHSIGWIQTQLHPNDGHYFIVNLHLMMQDVEMLRRKCRCDDDPKSIAEILRSFIRARGTDIKVDIWESNILNADGKKTFYRLKELIREINQPCLMELSSADGHLAYAVLIGYAEIPQGEYLECVFPTPYLGEKTYQRYFFRWDEIGKSLKIYYIMNPSGSEDV